MMQAPQFSLDSVSGRVTVDAWPEYCAISEVVLSQIAHGISPLTQWARLEGPEFLVFTVDNGRARYRIAGQTYVRMEGGLGGQRLELMDSELESVATEQMDMSEPPKPSEAHEVRGNVTVRIEGMGK